LPGPAAVGATWPIKAAWVPCTGADALLGVGLDVQHQACSVTAVPYRIIMVARTCCRGSGKDEFVIHRGRADLRIAADARRAWLVLVTTGGEPVPSWLRELAGAARTMDLSASLMPPARGGRRSAVLVLFAEGPDGPDLLFIQRSSSVRWHAGQPAFPGGVIDATDSGPVAAALREAAEEVGVDPGDVDVVATLPELFIPPTGFRVVPVLAWWRRPCSVGPVDVAEVAAVERVSVRELADPASRLMLHRPRGIVLPAFRVRGMLIWGLTAELVHRLLALAGWELQWDARVVEQ
jgi:8-oxo-dGTP pyrophosphatase MutT (NUDIX family)